MSRRFQKTRLLVAAALTSTVVAGTAYFVDRAPATSATQVAGGTSATTQQAPNAPKQKTTARRSRGS